MNGRNRLVCGIVAVVVGLAMVDISPARARKLTDTKPWAVVLCHASNDSVVAGTSAYYDAMYGDSGAGRGLFNLEDYWHDVSFGQLSMTGTEVVTGANSDAAGWHTVPQTRDAWLRQPNRFQKVVDCANTALGETDLSRFSGVMAVFPEAHGSIVEAMSATSTTLTVGNGSKQNHTVYSSNYWPNPPFELELGGEHVTVTAAQDNPDESTTFTVTRAVAGSTARIHDAGTYVVAAGDIVGGLVTAQFADESTRTLGLVVMPHQAPLSIVAHEIGHGYGYGHSRALSTSTDEYNDQEDLMSAARTYHYSGLGYPFGDSDIGAPAHDKGPGLTSINLDASGWIPSSRRAIFDNRPGRTGQHTYTLATLSDPDALRQSGSLQVRASADVTIEKTAPKITNPDGTQSIRPPTIPPTCTEGYECVKADYYTVDFRQRTGWDLGFPYSAVVLHLRGSDGLPYWIDRTPGGIPVGDGSTGGTGLLRAGEGYLDRTSRLFLFVNSIGYRVAKVTVASQRMELRLSTPDPLGPLAHGRPVRLTARLTVDGQPIPRQVVRLRLGAASCSGVSDVGGDAVCGITVTDHPGVQRLRAFFPGSGLFHNRTSTTSVTIPRIPTRLRLRHTDAKLIARVVPQGPRDGDPTGRVVFKVGKRVVGRAAVTSAGEASVRYALEPGQRFRAVYRGDQRYRVSTA